MTDPSDDRWSRTWSSYRRSWLRSLRGRQASKRTLSIYDGFIQMFAKYLQGLDRDERPELLEDLTHRHIQEFLAVRGEGGDSPAYVHQHFRNLRAFLNYMVVEEEIPASPMKRVQEPIVPKKMTPIIADGHVKALLHVCRGRDFASVRDVAIIRLLISTGGRRGEVAGLHVEQVDLDNDEIHVLGKGRKDRRIPYGAKTGQALERYLRVRVKQRYAHLPNLWLSASSRGALSPTGIGQMLDRRAKQAGIGHVHPHLFRHLLAHDWGKAGGNERDLMRVMGWSSDRMLDHYAASTAEERARDAHRRARLDDRF